jgi:curved DNA-binding protein CbpA
MAITVDFSKLKFNLYEILGVNSDSNEHKIKKAFRNLILNFHPDKNSDTEEDIYHHIITANQILCNPQNRKLYDDFLSYKEFDHNELKNDFLKNYDVQLSDSSDKSSAMISFNQKMKELELKHNINKFIEVSVFDTYEKEKNNRDQVLPIKKEEIKGNEEFNYKFNNRITNGEFQDQLIELNNGSLINVNDGDNYSSINVAFDNLYLEESNIFTNKYTSLDTAFKIQAINPTNFKEADIHESMENYKSNTDHYFSKNNTYTKDIYKTW